MGSVITSYSIHYTKLYDKLDFRKTSINHGSGYCGCFAKVEFASKSVKGCGFVFKYRLINHVVPLNKAAKIIKSVITNETSG